MVMRYRYLTIVFVMVLLTLINIASAGFGVGDVSHSIEGIYGKLDYIKGWINISLNNEPTNSVFGDSRGNSISLINLLNENPTSYTYSCSPLDCQTDYSASAGTDIKNFNLNSGESKIFGLKFSGDIININSINFDISSDAPVSCNNQLKIDFFDDGSIESQNNRSSNEVCSPEKNYGCFDDSQTTQEFSIDVVGNRPYCQRIILSEAPGFEIGAWVKNVSGLSETLIMALYDNDGSQVATCELPETISGGSEVSCNIEYLVSETENYYVCISSLGAGSGEYKINGYSDPVNGCGFYATPIPPNSPAAYQIFTQKKKFDAMGTLEISNSLLNGDSLNELAKEYISRKYGGFDCSNNCVVPIRFMSGANQAITINNLQARYETSAGNVEDKKFYNVTETPAIVNSEFQKLYLDEGNFSVPNRLGDYTFSLTLNNDDVIEEEVSVRDVPRINFVTPTKTASAFPTPFEVGVSFSSDITRYDWDFGDDSSIINTQINKTTHTYQSTGLYKLKITAIDKSGLNVSKIFDINVSLPKEVINSTLKDMKKNIENVKIQISAFDSFSQKGLNSTLGISFIDDELEDLEINFTLATSEEEYNQILSRLLDLSVPKLVTKSRSADSISFFPEKENIDVDIVKVISGGEFDTGKRERYKDAILAWNLENLEIKITFKEFSAKYDLFTEPFLKVFELKLSEIGDTGLDSYLIIDRLDNLEFDKNYLEEEESGYVYINLENLPTTIILSTTEDIDFIDLPVFVSPPLNKLTLSEDFIEDGEDEAFKWNIFILIIFFLVLTGFITYIVLQQWYKRKYENYLFKNRTDLYNMVTYVNNAKKKGLKRGEISENLRKAGWSSEKIRYVIRKYVGKRTGMLEIPVTKVLDKLKKKRRL